MFRLLLLSLLLVPVALFRAPVPRPAEAADIVLLNGRIWTADPSNRFAEAVAIKGNRILAVGTTSAIRAHVAGGTRVMDLQGKLVLPGFNDAHIHFLTGSLGLSNMNLFACKNLKEMAVVIRDYAAQHPGTGWLTGSGWQYTSFPGGMPHKAFLDSLVPDRPVYLRAYDGHSGWANSKALALAGINRETVFDGFGAIIRDSNGEATGALTERAQSLVSRLIPPPTEQEQLNALRLGMRYAASLGITSVQNASGSPAEFSLYQQLLQSGELTLRSTIAFSVGKQTNKEDIRRFIEARRSANQPQWLKAHAIKFMLDGVIESHTAALLQPYSDMPSSDPHPHGQLALTPEQYRPLVERLDYESFQLYTHAIGDAAVREALDAYERSAAANGQRDRRHRVEHIEIFHSQDLPRFAALGVIPSMQPIHADPGTVDVWSRAVGENRLPFAFAWSSFLQTGARLAFGSDWPACIDPDPLHGIHVAVNRRTLDGIPAGGWIPQQRISLEDALYAYTRGAAYASFDEGQKGMLAPGYLADLVVLSSNLFEIAPMGIGSTRVLLTLVDGKVVYERESS
ncbi:MAG TPA: amidohydrolase [Lacibacter sp.]|nr:amidohydrolase [Lacibacter sp.]HMO90336.1 amidohydrolase [Lacibacter sp.]HMP86552.1 amidohydrolase [Lacibacter sp.]